MTPEDKELVEWLRNLQYSNVPTQRQAAEAIERLSKSIDLKDAAIRQLNSDNERMKQTIGLMDAALGEIEADNKRLMAELELCRFDAERGK